MPQIANIVLADGASTPVNHTFGVMTTDGALAKWNERSAGTPAGFYTLSHEVRAPTQSGGADRIIVGLNVPVMATVDGVLQVTRFSSAQVTLNLSHLSTVQERKDLLAYVTNFLSNATVKTSVENVEPFY
jgi:hypothetical protein